MKRLREGRRVCIGAGLTLEPVPSTLNNWSDKRGKKSCLVLSEVQCGSMYVLHISWAFVFGCLRFLFLMGFFSLLTLEFYMW